MTIGSDVIPSEDLARLRRVSSVHGLAAVAWTWAWIAACFVVYALYPTPWTVLGTLFVMSGRHLAHTWTERDPDLALAAALPVTRESFRRKMLRDLTGQSAYTRLRALVRLSCGLAPDKRGLEGQSVATLSVRFVRQQYGFLLWQALLLMAATLLGHPEAYLWIWWLPALTGYASTMTLARGPCEHLTSERRDKRSSPRSASAPNTRRAATSAA